MKTFKMDMSSFTTPQMTGYVFAETKEDALQQYIDHILSGANTIKIYEVNEDKVITSIHKSRIGSGEYESLQRTGSDITDKKVGDTVYLWKKIEPQSYSLF